MGLCRPMSGGPVPRKGRGGSRKSPSPFPAGPLGARPAGSAMSPVRAVLALLAALAAPAASYFVSIDAHAEECFLERVPSGTKMGLIFEVAEGGFLDIDVEVRRGGRERGPALSAAAGLPRGPVLSARPPPPRGGRGGRGSARRGRTAARGRFSPAVELGTVPPCHGPLWAGAPAVRRARGLCRLVGPGQRGGAGVPLPGLPVPQAARRSCCTGQPSCSWSRSLEVFSVVLLGADLS